MPVAVRVAGPRPEKFTHDEGQDMAVDDAGNLVITAREGRGEWVVAVYAAGSWTSAESTGAPPSPTSRDDQHAPRRRSTPA